MSDENRILFELKSSLLSILRKHPDLEDAVDKMLAKLSQLEASVRQRRPVRRRTGEHITYFVATVSGAEVLTEHRTSGTSYPYRVSRSVYDAVAEAIANAERPQSYDDIARQVSGMLPAPPGDYQIRAVLRFWLRDDPPLVERNRSRYYPIDAKQFLQSAKKQWNRLANTRQMKPSRPR